MQKNMKKEGLKISKTVIIADYTCNNNCLFCIDSEKRSILPRSTATIIKEMKEARKRDNTYLELIGGELTLREDIFLIIDCAKKLGFDTIAMATNGRMLAYLDFAKKLIEAGLTHIIFSIHGHTHELHDSLTRAKGSLKQLLQGLKNLKTLNFKQIGSNTTIVKQNYRSLPKIGRFIKDLNIYNAEFIFVDPNYGGARSHFEELVPRISDVAPYAHACLDLYKNSGASHWHIRYVPLCYFIGYKDQISELHEYRTFKTEHLAPDFRNFDVEGTRGIIGRIKPTKCKICKEFHICEGIWKEYYNHFGDGELKPIIKT